LQVGLQAPKRKKVSHQGASQVICPYFSKAFEMDNYGGDTYGGANTLRAPGEKGPVNIPVHSPINPQVFFDVAVGEDKHFGRIIIELREDVCPKTAENFRSLCTNNSDRLSAKGNPMFFKGSAFHRIIPKFCLQGGDFDCGNGMGGESIYGKHFDDENFTLTHYTPGAVTMSNCGRNTNSSQFFLTTSPLAHMNGKHVVFGFVVAGMETVLKLEKLGSSNGRTREAVTIHECGELSTSQKISPQAASIQTTEAEAVKSALSLAPKLETPLEKIGKNYTPQHRQSLFTFFRQHDTKELYNVDTRLAEMESVEALSAELRTKYGEAPAF
jgi:peptidylprolyl isomerase